MRLWADFNRAEDNILITSLRRTPGALADDASVGSWVELYDREGHTCAALVIAVEGSLVQCVLDMKTWRFVDARLEPSYVPATSARATSEAFELVA